MISHSYQEKQERGRGKKAHLTDMLRDVWTGSGLAQNHTSLLGVVEVKAVLQLRLINHLCAYALQNSWGIKGGNWRMTPAGSQQEEKSIYGKKGGHKKKHKHYVWEKPRHAKCPCAICLKQFLSHLLWITRVTLLTSFILPLTSHSPQTSFLFQEWWLTCCNLWNKQLLKEGCSEFYSSHANLSKENNNSQKHSVEQDDVK